MNYPEHPFRKALEEHENLAPDPGAVYNRVETLAQAYRRRRVLMQSASGMLLGAGVLLGLVQMNAFIQGGVAEPPSAPPPTAAGGRESTPPSAEPPTIDNELDAYFNAGYDWDEAEKLARLWKLDDPYDAKIEGGRRLLAGEHLPIRPN